MRYLTEFLQRLSGMHMQRAFLIGEGTYELVFYYFLLIGVSCHARNVQGFYFLLKVIRFVENRHFSTSLSKKIIFYKL